ncbi:hypothetical protein Sango_2997600 [Sesamum angolense]|uniref:Uncharacterized protein n=1 Tax=Sesamum angolense TaxID=2727404 RepID=A0AAE1T455_9LAMI|nr:hypothetical protein Sango_2997600 [Sesamum angolense]
MGTEMKQARDKGQKVTESVGAPVASQNFERSKTEAEYSKDNHPEKRDKGQQVNDNQVEQIQSHGKQGNLEIDNTGTTTRLSPDSETDQGAAILESTSYTTLKAQGENYINNMDSFNLDDPLMAELLDRDWEAEKNINSSSKTTFHNEEGNLGGLDHELRSTSKLKATGKASRRSPKSGDKDSKSTTTTGTRILLRGECSNRRQRNKLLSEMDIIEIQATLEASEIEAQDIQESSDKEEAVTPIFNRFQSLEDSDSLLELDPELQVIPNSTDSTPGDYIHDQGLDSGILPQPQAQVGEHEINQNVNVKSLESNLQEHILEDSVISNRLKRNNSMEDNSIKTGKAAGKGKKNKGNSAIRTFPKRHTRFGFYSVFSSISNKIWCLAQFGFDIQVLKRLSLDKVPWIVGGDFNTMLHPHENRGGTINSLGSIEDFNAMVLDSGLTDAGFEGEPFNGLTKGLQQKLYRLKGHLKQWNRDIFGNVFSLVDQAKAAASEAEKQFDRLPSEANLINLNRQNVALAHALNLESEIWRQKKQLQMA